MIRSYTKFPSDIAAEGFVLRPMLEINMYSGGRKVSALAHLDTGADHVLMNKGLADTLGLEWKGGQKGRMVGIEGSPMPVYYHDIEIEIAAMAGSKRTVKAGFINSKAVGILLGQVGFFEFFNVTFEYQQNVFEVSLP